MQRNAETEQGWYPAKEGGMQTHGPKLVPLKKPDGDMLTRKDIQYNFLDLVFNDPTRCFSDLPGDSPNRKVTFGELYCNAIKRAVKTTKSMREKFTESPPFRLAYAKLCLLVNIGRLNTTVAFYPEMRTVLRAFHPAPSLQKDELTRKYMTDVPRMKQVLKSYFLSSEAHIPVTTFNKIESNIASGLCPPTAVSNLLFVMTVHAATVSKQHFHDGFEFHDLFMPSSIPSRERCRAFLWLMYHYHEPRMFQNPFADSFCETHPGKVPMMYRPLNEESIEEPNVDTPEELEYGRIMKDQRQRFLTEMNTEPPRDYTQGEFHVIEWSSPGEHDSHRNGAHHRVDVDEERLQPEGDSFRVPKLDLSHSRPVNLVSEEWRRIKEDPFGIESDDEYTVDEERLASYEYRLFLTRKASGMLQLASPLTT